MVSVVLHNIFTIILFAQHIGKEEGPVPCRMSMHPPIVGLRRLVQAGVTDVFSVVVKYLAFMILDISSTGQTPKPTVHPAATPRTLPCQPTSMNDENEVENDDDYDEK